MGYIYILTNKSFPDWIKIGYASDVDKRLCELNRSECTPFAFHLYATYEVESKLSDKNIHGIIDGLNHTLRSREKLENGKERVREFFNMSPEDAYQIFADMAALHNCQDKLKRYEHDKLIGTEQTCEPLNIAEDKPCKVNANKRSPFRFSMCNIKVGDKVVFVKDPQISCRVIGDNTIEYEGKNYSLSGLAQELTGSKSLAGTHFFTYNGEIINDLRKRIEQKIELNEKIISNVDNKRRPNFSFEQCGIKIGELLTFVKEPSITCIVADNKKVKYQGQVYSVSGLAKKLLGKTQGVNGFKYFSHNGKVLLDLWIEHCARQQ